MGKWSPEDIAMFERTRKYLEEKAIGIDSRCEDFNKIQRENNSGLEIESFWSPNGSIAILLRGFHRSPSNQRRSVDFGSTGEVAFLNEDELRIFAEFAGTVTENDPNLRIVKDTSTRNLSREEIDNGPLEVIYAIKPVFENFKEDSSESSLPSNLLR